GVYDGDPSLESSNIIKTFSGNSRELNTFVVAKKSDFGRGGMITKCRNALKVAGLGIPVHIANGRTEGIILALMQQKTPGTLFPATNSTSTLKKWVASSNAYSKGKLIVNEGAKNALFAEKANSLLPIGVTALHGQFNKGDIISIFDENQLELGLGISSYSANHATNIIGKRNHKPIIHYDYLYLFELN
ncbi:MAG: PUA domain-containing protein, partial [Bacteroidota bacterium]